MSRHTLEVNGVEEFYSEGQRIYFRKINTIVLPGKDGAVCKHFSGLLDDDDETTGDSTDDDELLSFEDIKVSFFLASFSHFGKSKSSLVTLMCACSEEDCL